MKKIVLSALVCFFSLHTFARAQDPAAQTPALPTPPAPIQTLVQEGAQIRYLGNDHGFDAWLTVKNGQEQYFYVPPSGDAFFMGVMFDKEGKLVTVRQVAKLREDGDELLDQLANVTQEQNGSETNKSDAFNFKTPAEQMFADVEASNWISLGNAQAPILYSFIDPQCPHCHDFILNVQKAGYLDNGQVQLRVVPVGFKEETVAQSAFLLAAPNPQEKLFSHLNGDEKALPAKSDINQQGVQRNLAVMSAWKFDVTPMIIYRAKDGTVKIVRGTPKDLSALIQDLG